MCKGRPDCSSTVVTAGDGAYAWGALMLAASMRKNEMAHPVVVGAMGWPEAMKDRIRALWGVTVKELPDSRQCVACQKPLLMGCEEVETEWVCWADADGAFIGDCSQWLAGDDENEIVIRKYDPAPPDFTPANLEIWRRDVARVQGAAAPESRYATRVNTAFIVLNRKWRWFLSAWAGQIGKVLPADVRIIMKQGTAYFQTDESVLASLLCFLPGAPKIAERYCANGSVDKSRYFAHFAYNPKPWQMWNRHSSRWHGEIADVVAWLVDKGIVKKGDVPLSLRNGWWPFWRAMAPLAPWAWRAMKLKRRIFRP